MMSQEDIDYRVNLAERMIESSGAESFNMNRYLTEIIDPITGEHPDEVTLSIIKKSILSRISYIASSDNAILIPVSSVTDLTQHEPWYQDWLEEQSDVTRHHYYWDRLQRFLARELSKSLDPYRAAIIVRSIDDATHSIMEQLANPRRAEFDHKGLVVGYVQSGKTANFTALIAKAVDTGYRLVIVLTGIHNVLRHQTQVRLDKELTGVKDVQSEANYISPPSNYKKWIRLTTAENDFVRQNIEPFDFNAQYDRPMLAVVKKNTRVLQRLIDYINQADEDARRKIPVLLIDDEADQASIDSNANSDDDPTRTNELIRRLLTQFKRTSYVGYTATPFANVLIDMNASTDALSSDLYPRNFITALPEPEGYFGTQVLFNGKLADEFVKHVPEGEAEDILRGSDVTTHLARAIDEYLLGCCIRNLRGDRTKPMSMLVHVSFRKNDMTTVQDAIESYIRTLEVRIGSTDFQSSELRKEMQAVFELYIGGARNVIALLNMDLKLPSFDDTYEELVTVLNKVQILKLNSDTDDELHYSRPGEVKIIAIGGNKLSRGLTLEGLMISYYLRNSAQYDTLLQMGRWFGYRQGYEDLTRIYTTETIAQYFEHLALVEAEIRSEIYRYEEEDSTPSELAIAIRAHQRLRVTAKNKMGAATARSVSYSDSLNQTIWFPLDDPIRLRANLDTVNSFIRTVNKTHTFQRVDDAGIYLAQGKVSDKIVMKLLLEPFEFATRSDTGGPGLDSIKLLEYIRRRTSAVPAELKNWSVAVVGNKSSTPQNPPIQLGGITVNPIQRSRKYTNHGYNVGVLTEPTHLTIDLPDTSTSRSADNPLLLIYIISKDSQARKKRESVQVGTRVDLYYEVSSERINIVGLAIILPKSRSERNNYIGQ